MPDDELFAQAQAGTLRQNLMLGNPHASEQDMLQALRVSGALSLIRLIMGVINVTPAVQRPQLLWSPDTVAVAHGGTSIEEAPGLREGRMGALYLAYVRDPDGNKLCALYRPAKAK